jgi:23S rRNA (pseudouridine1915-N3)-methyltransferase
MNLILAHVGAASSPLKAYDTLIHTYMERCATFAHPRTEAFRTEQAFLDWLDKQNGRTQAVAVLLDSRGKQFSSENFAAWLGNRRDEGAQQIVFAIGPADGWSEPARKRAQLLLSFGPMTLAHPLARLVMAEQLYRAYAILSGHPYHSGH